MSRTLRWFAVIGVALVVFGPLGLILYQSFLNEPFFSQSARFSLDAYRYILSDSGFHSAFGTSLVVSFGMTLISVPSEVCWRFFSYGPISLERNGLSHGFSCRFFFRRWFWLSATSSPLGPWAFSHYGPKR